MTAFARLSRKDSRFVRIAHISDLHFTQDTRFLDRNNPDSFLTKIADDLVKQQPDVLCVTGDIVDSYWLEALKAKTSSLWSRIRGTGNQGTRKPLLDTLVSARTFFEELCTRVGIDSKTALFVVPGNHDFRVQGFLKQNEQAVSVFRDVFRSYFRNAHLLFDSIESEPIAVTVVSIDSNGTDPVGTFASGAITESEFRKFAVFDECKKVLTAECQGPVAPFRVCLLHHHPLPVVPAENYRELATDAGAVDKIKASIKVLTGSQTTLLKNAGGFLSSAIAAQVDLVLHGHEHKPWISELRYPGIGGLNRILVGAAGSAGVETADAYAYNVATLHRDASIRLVQRRLVRSMPQFENEKNSGESQEPGYSAPSPGELRELRHRKAVGLLSRHALPGSEYSAMQLTYGALRADKATRVTRLQLNGNAYVTRSFENLEATDAEVRYLPLVSRSVGGYQGVGTRPNIRTTIAPGGRKYHIELRRADDVAPNQTVWILDFEPPLEQGFPVTFEVTYLLCNGYEFVTEYRRARQAQEPKARALDGCEGVSNRARAIFPKRLSETVIFPEGWSPTEPPIFRVYDSKGTIERFEQDYCEKWLQYVEGGRLASISVEFPLPNLTYELSWRLQSKQDYERRRYDGDALSRRSAFAYGACDSKDKIRRLEELIEELRREISIKQAGQSVALADEKTEMSLFIVQFKNVGAADRPGVKTSLMCCVQLPKPGTGGVTYEAFDSGVGLVGQAYRSERLVFDASEGRSGFYTMVSGQTTPHSFLCAIPLAVPISARAGEGGKAPIYAILCLGSYVAGSGLEVLRSRSPLGEITRLWLTDQVIGRLNGKAFEVLTS